MTIDMSQFYQVFFEEAGEHLATMENLLLNLNVEAPNLDDLNAIFRAAHSIKGGSGTFGFTDMTEVTHELETLLDKLRKEELALRVEMIDAFLRAGDVLKAQLEAHQTGGDVEETMVKDVCAELKQLYSGEVESIEESREEPATASAASPSGSDNRTRKRTCLLEFPRNALAKPKAGIKGLLASLEELGITEQLSGQKDDNVCISVYTDAPIEQIKEIFDFIGNTAKLSINEGQAAAKEEANEEDQSYGFFTDTEAPTTEAADESYGFFTDIETTAVGAEDQGFGFFVEPETLKTQAEEAQGYGFFAEPEAIEAQRDEERGYGFFTTPEPDVQAKPQVTTSKPSEIKTAASKPVATREKTAPPSAASSETTSIRVSTEKVDQLINLVGELVITQAMLAQTASEVDPVIYEKLLNGMAQLERNTRDLQESVMSIRMMPISFVFSRFPRVVRDLASKLKKQVELKTVGEGTELDKGLIEKIADPLTHLVRNSLDHGIESPEVRLAAGKDAKGTITLRASHQGGNIVIEVIDDGGGLSRDKILSKARERGINVSENPSDHEVWQLIFAPGFSTAEVVTDVSGRGVGMDVVKRNIEGMGGRVEIDSIPGHGTRMIIRLPLTLAILDGMSIAVGEDVFILPLAIIVESLQPPKEDVKTVAGEGRVVHVRGEYLPLIALHEIFNLTPRVTEPDQGILVIIESDGNKAALFVDELVGQHQVVIKSLESNYRKVDGVSGATIMGDGKVALILDVPALVRMSKH